MRSILGRYSRDADGRIIIDIAASRIADLYNDWDRNTPYIRKDLSPDLVSYISESVTEIRGEPFVLQFSLTELPQAEMQHRLQGSVANYFYYLRELMRARILGNVRKMVTLLLAGLCIIIAAVWVNQRLESGATVLQLVFAEGLTIAGWVSLWQAVATVLLDIPPQLRRLHRYGRIARATIRFNQALSPTATKV